MTPMPFISPIRTLTALLGVSAAILAAPVPANAQAGFNGTWSVLIITNSGPCDRAYRYPLRVNNGRVTYAGQADFSVSGSVRSNGAVNVTVSRGDQRASGSGWLGGGSGSGTWRGAGPSSACSGTWTAEKRG
jgi:hypothetical protein